MCIVDRRRKFHIKTVVFDGYNKSAKDATHKVRSKKMSQTVEISDGNVCHLDRADFLTNYTNINEAFSIQVRTSRF